jgi:hypothetical protein
MLKARDDSDLALEPLNGDRVARIGRKDLDHDLAPERSFRGEEDARHPAAAKLPLEDARVAKGGLELFAKVSQAASSSLRWGKRTADGEGRPAILPRYAGLMTDGQQPSL